MWTPRSRGRSTPRCPVADLISAEEARKILANVDDCGSCDRQSIVTRLAETVVGLHAEVKRLSTANIDLLARLKILHDLSDSLSVTLQTLRTVLTEGYATATGDPDGSAAPLIDLAKAVCASLQPLHDARDAALNERDAMRRRMETMPPWEVSEVPTDEEMAALRLRWAFGPERYQADADSLIAAVMHLRNEIARITAERDRLQRVCNEWLTREHIDCPKCGKQHIDGANDSPFATRPYHTHLCQFCGEVFDTGRWSFGADVREEPVSEEPVSAETVAMQAEVAPTEQGAP